MARAKRALGRLRGHSVLFGGVNAFLLIINLVIGISFPWFLFPLGGWAILLAAHYALFRQHRRQEGEMDALEELSPYQTSLVRKLHRGRSAFAVSLLAAGATALFLVMTNLIVSPDFPWSAITGGALALAELTHYLVFSSRLNRRLERLADGLPPATLDILSQRAILPFLGGARRAGSEVPEVAEARRLVGRIGSQLAARAGDRPSPARDIVPLLDRYLAQIVDLAGRRAEIAALERRSAPADLLGERERLAERLQSAQSEALRSEYERSLSQLDTRLESVRRLQERREIADLRIASAISALKQLEVDIVRMNGIPDTEDSAVSRMLGEKSRELSEYLEDVAAGRRELEELG